MLNTLKLNCLLFSTALLMLNCSYFSLQSRVCGSSFPKKEKQLEVKQREEFFCPQESQDTDCSGTVIEPIETEEEETKERWRDRTVTKADMMDLAVHTVGGVGVGSVVGGITHTIAASAIASTTGASTTAVATAAAQTVGEAAITAVAEIAPAASAAVSKAVLAATAKVTGVTTTIISAPVAIGIGATVGGSLGLYWAWSNWKNS